MRPHRLHITVAAAAAVAAAALPGTASATSGAKCDVDMARNAGSSLYQGTARCAGRFGRTTLLGGAGQAVARLAGTADAACRTGSRPIRLQVLSPLPLTFFAPHFATLRADLTLVRAVGGVVLSGTGTAQSERVRVTGAGKGCRRLQVTLAVTPRGR